MIINTINNDYLEKHIRVQPITISFVESHSERYGMDIVETGWTCNDNWYNKHYTQLITLSETDFLSTYRV